MIYLTKLEGASTVLQTVWAIIREGKVQLLENITLPEGAKVLVTVMHDEEEQQFWLHASERALDDVWGNAEDDVYAELLQR